MDGADVHMEVMVLLYFYLRACDVAGAAVHVGDDICFASLLGFAADCAAVHMEMMVLFFCFRAYRLAGLLRGELNGAAVHIEDDGFWFLLGSLGACLEAA